MDYYIDSLPRWQWSLVFVSVWFLMFLLVFILHSFFKSFFLFGIILFSRMEKKYIKK